MRPKGGFTLNPSRTSGTWSKYILPNPRHSIETCNKEEPTIFIILTGWNDKYNRNLPFYFKVPYSSHSNYRELEQLVKAIQPKNIVFTVPDREMSKKRLEFQRYLINEYVQRPNKLRGEFDPRTGMVKACPAAINAASSNSTGVFKEEEKNGYACGDYNLSERFNPNNKEMNTRRFNEANAHILKSR
jgi:hypothetical protein